jgi:hypothetical protein
MKRKKIYYLPGMISLIGLPLFVWIFPAPHHQAQDRVYSKPLRLVLPSDNTTTGWVRNFSKRTFLHDIRRKRILEVDFNEVRSAPYDSLLQYQKALIFQKMSELQFLHDTTAVLKIDFGDDNTYGDFMWLLNLAHQLMFKHYAFFDNSFYILGNPRPAPTPKDSKADQPQIYL